MVISDHASVVQGEAGLLACVGQGYPTVEITWMHNGQTIINSSATSIFEEDVIQGERLFKQSFLRICNINIEDAGSYVCILSNGETSVTSSTQLTVAGK